MSKLIGRKVKIIKGREKLKPSFFFEGTVGQTGEIMSFAQQCPGTGHLCVLFSNGQFIPIECLRYLNNKEVKL